MRTIRELAKFMQAAAAKREDSYLPVTGLYALGVTEAAQAVAEEHGADKADVAFVGAALFVCWNDALEWAEARVMKPSRKEFTCPECGSHYFGSGQVGDGALERKCHGELCAFRFHQRDDHLYFEDVDDD